MFLLPESSEVDDVNKASETVCSLKWVRPTTGGVFYLIPLLKNTYSRYIYSHLQITVDVVTVNLLFLQLVSN
jgi:hypothetical protein